MADIRKEQERDELHRAIWAIADELRGSVSADRKRPIKCRMKPIRQTDSDNACSVVAPTLWTSCPLTVPAIVGLCPSW